MNVLKSRLKAREKEIIGLILKERERDKDIIGLILRERERPFDKLIVKLGKLIKYKDPKRSKIKLNRKNVTQTVRLQNIELCVDWHYAQSSKLQTTEI